jgi:hypothetical protein
MSTPAYGSGSQGLSTKLYTHRGPSPALLPSRAGPRPPLLIIIRSKLTKNTDVGRAKSYWTTNYQYYSYCTSNIIESCLSLELLQYANLFHKSCLSTWIKVMTNTKRRGDQTDTKRKRLNKQCFKRTRVLSPVSRRGLLSRRILVDVHYNR